MEMNKKVATVLIMALVAMTSVFAVVTPKQSGLTVNGAQASTQVSMHLAPEDITYYLFGFTNDMYSINRPGIDMNPPQLETIDLTLNEDKKSASSSKQLYMYYYYQGKELPTLTLKAGDGLTRDDYEGDIDYVIKVGGNTNIEVASTDAEGKKLPLGKLNNGVTGGFFDFSIETTTEITPDMASTKNNWTDTITLTISNS